MQVLQCRVPEECLEGHRCVLQHVAQGHLPAAEAMAAGGQGQGDDAVGGAASEDGGVPMGGRVGITGGQSDGSTAGWRGRGLGVMREGLALTSMLVDSVMRERLALTSMLVETD